MEKWTGLDGDVIRAVLLSIGIAVALGIARSVLVGVSARRIADARVRYTWRKGITYVTVTAAVLLIARVWFEGLRSLTTYLGLLSAGLAIALQSLVLNVAGWAFIVWRRPFAVGDRVQIGAYTGDVIDIGVFSFAMLEVGNWVSAEQSTGRTVRVPNGRIFTETVANYTGEFDFIWAELPVLVTFESDWEEAKQVLTRVVERQTAAMAEEAEAQLERASRHLMVQYSRLTPTVYTRVVESGIELTLRFVCAPRSRRDVEQSIWEDILREFARRERIDLAYPTRRTYSAPTEGKPAMRPPADAAALADGADQKGAEWPTR